MANDLMRMAWKVRMPIGRKAVLLALADKADADGVSWPSRELLAVMAECSPSTVSRHLTQLIADGWVAQQRRRQRSALYQVDRTKLEQYQRDVASCEVSTPDLANRDISNRDISPCDNNGSPAPLDLAEQDISNHDVAQCEIWRSPADLDVAKQDVSIRDVAPLQLRPRTGATSLKGTPKESPRESSLPASEAEPDPPAKPARRKPAKPLPADWEPTDTHRAYAERHGLNLEHEMHKFRSHAEANDRRQANWNGAFSTWLAKAVEFRPRYTANGSGDPPWLHRDPTTGRAVER